MTTYYRCDNVVCYTDLTSVLLFTIVCASIRYSFSILLLSLLPISTSFIFYLLPEFFSIPYHKDPDCPFPVINIFLCILPFHHGHLLLFFYRLSSLFLSRLFSNPSLCLTLLFSSSHFFTFQLFSLPPLFFSFHIKGKM